MTRSLLLLDSNTNDMTLPCTYRIDLGSPDSALYLLIDVLAHAGPRATAHVRRLSR